MTAWPHRSLRLKTMIEETRERGLEIHLRSSGSTCGSTHGSPRFWPIISSLACIIALAIVLYVYDGAPTPRLKFGVTLIAIASILATAARTFFGAAVAATTGQLKWRCFTNSRQLHDMQTLDAARRGILGSLQMLFNLRRQPVYQLACLDRHGLPLIYESAISL